MTKKNPATKHTEKKFKTTITVELPKELDANILLLTYNPESFVGTELALIKAAIGKAIHEIIADYPDFFMSSYNIKK